METLSMVIMGHIRDEFNYSHIHLSFSVFSVKLFTVEKFLIFPNVHDKPYCVNS